jgi:hypothetical protein
MAIWPASIVRSLPGERQDAGWAYVGLGSRQGADGVGPMGNPYAGFFNISRGSFLLGWADTVERNVTAFEDRWREQFGAGLGADGKIDVGSEGVAL